MTEGKIGNALRQCSRLQINGIDLNAEQESVISQIGRIQIEDGITLNEHIQAQCPAREAEKGKMPIWKN